MDDRPAGPQSKETEPPSCTAAGDVHRPGSYCAPSADQGGHCRRGNGPRPQAFRGAGSGPSVGGGVVGDEAGCLPLVRNRLTRREASSGGSWALVEPPTCVQERSILPPWTATRPPERSGGRTTGASSPVRGPPGPPVPRLQAEGLGCGKGRFRRKRRASWLIVAGPSGSAALTGRAAATLAFARPVAEALLSPSAGALRSEPAGEALAPPSGWEGDVGGSVGSGELWRCLSPCHRRVQGAGRLGGRR